MAYPNFQFPGVELTQEFVETPVTGVSALGVALIGQKYAISNAATTNPVISVAYTGGTASVAFANLPASIKTPLSGDPAPQVIDTTFDQTIVVEDGKFEEVTISGGTVVLSSGSTSAHTFDLSATAAGVTEAEGKSIDVSKGGTTYTGIITDVSVEGATATLTAQFDVAFNGGTVNASIYSKATAVVGVAGTTQYLTVENGLSLPANMKMREGEPGAYTYNGKALIGGSKFYVYYRNIVTTTKYALGSVASVTDIVQQLGWPCADNPLALDVLFAFNAAAGNVVYYVATLTTITDPVLKYSGALDFLAKNPEVYSIVPDIEASDAVADASYAQAIKQMLAQVVNDSSDKESKIRRTLWFGVKNPDTTDRTELVKDITDNALNIHNYRAQAVWADDALYNGEVIPNSALAAAAAGMRAGQPVHRPISNLGYDTFSISEKYGLTKTELEALGANGIWIIGPNFYGTPINMRQVTTDNSGSLMKFEESIISNVDSIALSLCHLGESMVGCSNISPALLTALKDSITTVMSSKTKNMTGSDLIGPQLIAWSLDSIYQDTVFRDRVYATITCEPPRPFNRFVMTLRVV